MVILLCYTSAFSEVIYADFYAKILDRNFRLVDENSRILVVVFVSKLNFSFSFVDENYRIFVVIFVKINLLSSTKILVFVVIDEKNTVPEAKISRRILHQSNIHHIYFKHSHDI